MEDHNIIYLDARITPYSLPFAEFIINHKNYKKYTIKLII